MTDASLPEGNTRMRIADDPTTLVIGPAPPAHPPRLGRLGALPVESHHAFDPERFLPTRDRMPAACAAFLVGQLDAPFRVPSRSARG